jgi:hypothetical protein
MILPLFLVLLFPFMMNAGNINLLDLDTKQMVNVHEENIDAVLRSVKSEQDFSDYLQAGNGIQVTQDEAGHYHLQSKIGLKGGGVGGAAAGAAVGKFLTYGVCYGAINFAAIFTGPAAAPVSIAANLTAAPFIELLSNKVAIGCGILGALFTGPV